MAKDREREVQGKRVERRVGSLVGVEIMCDATMWLIRTTAGREYLTCQEHDTKFATWKQCPNRYKPDDYLMMDWWYVTY